MLPDLMKAGYIGLVAALSYFSYQALINLLKSNRPLAHIITVLMLFFSMNLVAGIAGYSWSVKELEAATVRNNTAEILNIQIDKLSNEYKTSILPLQKILDDISGELKYSSLESTREQRIKEIERINIIIQQRDKLYSEKINSLKNLSTATSEK